MSGNSDHASIMGCYDAGDDDAGPALHAARTQKKLTAPCNKKRRKFSLPSAFPSLSSSMASYSHSRSIFCGNSINSTVHDGVNSETISETVVDQICRERFNNGNPWFGPSERQDVHALYAVSDPVDPEESTMTSQTKTDESEFHAPEMKVKGRTSPTETASEISCNVPSTTAVLLDKIFEMIMKLKMVDYWKHLPAEPWWQGDGNNKENKSEDDDHEDDDDDEQERNPFCCRVLSGGQQSCPCDHCNNGTTTDGGFVIKQVTDDGWICVAFRASPSISSTPPSSSSQCCDDDQPEQRRLLRLPLKVTKLAKPGMRVVGIELWERLNNGVLEPCFSSA